MRVVVLALAASAAVRSGKEQVLRRDASEQDRAQQDAMAVLASLLKVLEQEQKAEAGLEDQFEAWCTDAESGRHLLADEVQRRIREAQTSLDQLSAEGKRLSSEVGLSTSAQDATKKQQTALGKAQDELAKDVAGELDLLARATELTRHAMRLAHTHETSDDAAVAETEESRKGGLTDTLSALLEEIEAQKQQVVEERDQLVEAKVNLTEDADRAASFLSQATATITVEGRERARAAARYQSELADLRRLVTSVGAAANTTEEVCQEQRQRTRDHDGVTAAEIDAVRTALESLGPEDVLAPSFPQVGPVQHALEHISGAVKSLFGPKEGALSVMSPPFLQLSEQASGVDKFTAFVTRMAKTSTPDSPFAKAALALQAVQPKEEKEAPTSSDPLAEIAAFGAGEADDGETQKVTETYQALERDLETELKRAKDLQQACEDSSSHAKTAAERVGAEKSFADAKLAVLNATSEELSLQERYFQQQATALDQEADGFDQRVKEEGAQTKHVSEKLKGFAQQLVSVSAGLTRASSAQSSLRKVAKEAERLVERVEAHVSWLQDRSKAYGDWQEKLHTSFASLDRVLSVDLSHAKRKSNEYDTERAYTVSMDRAKERDALDAADGETEASDECPPAQQQARAAQQALLSKQIHDLHVLWGTLRL